MLLKPVSITTSDKFPLLPPLRRGNQTHFPMKNPEDAHFSYLIKREAQRVMDLNGLSPLAKGLPLSITVYDNAAADDPLLVIKLVMDALTSICYLDDLQVDEVYFQVVPIAMKRNGYKALPFMEIRCGHLPIIRVQGSSVRGMRYPLYMEQDIIALSQQHEAIQQQVEMMLAASQLHSLSRQQEVDVAFTIEQTHIQADVDNIILNYWNAMKTKLSITSNLVKSFIIKRDVSSLHGPGNLQVSLLYQ